MKRISLLLAAAAAVLLGATAQGQPSIAGASVEVVATLAPPPLGRRSLASASGRRVARAQAAFERALRAAIPTARVRWRYRTVLDGLAVVLPASEEPRLASLPGVRDVYQSVLYRHRLYSSPQAIGAPQLWGPTLATAGDGIKIGIIDDGVDARHPFLSPKGFKMPPGFPKGQVAYTTAKVIVARSFPPPSPRSKYADAPFDPVNSFHGTHVAGIAAGDYGTPATLAGQSLTLSGIAPHAYIGNYRALTVPTPVWGLDGNSPEIAAAIEAAVRDGMNVINLSLGEPEVTPQRDLVVQAIEGAARAGVVPVVAAGNDFDLYGRGSVNSPANAPDAIAVAAATKAAVMASFSSAGPTPISLELKPDLTAPGSDILSSVPASQGTWAVYQGTSMATPHVAGAVALLLQRHPGWTVAQVKSALVQTALPAYVDAGRRVEAPTTREGGGFVNLPRADDPLLFAAPTGLSFGLIRPGAAPVMRVVLLTDAGGGLGAWTPSLQQPDPLVAVPDTTTVPGTLAVTVTVPPGTAEGDHTGFVVLTRGSDARRIPYWFHVETPHLGAAIATLTRTGTYSGDTSRGAARVSTYRYPEDPGGAGLSTSLAGPEVVYRVRITKPVANFGVAVLHGAKIEPRVVVADDENRLTGYAGLPVNLNPYESWWGRREPIAGAVLPARGVYDVVFDEADPASAGPFAFRFWIDDTTPPTLRLLTPTVDRPGTLLLVARDAGAGVDPNTLQVKIDGADVTGTVLPDGRITIPLGILKPGRHRAVVSIADHQEAKNMEDVGPILPNTRTLRATFVVR